MANCLLPNLGQMRGARELASRLPRTPPQTAEILRYFVQNPDVPDTLEGIAQWRLLEGIVRRSVTEVNVALQWLVSEGFLVEISMNGAAPLFVLNHEKVPQAERFLRQVSPGGHPLP